MFSIFWGPIILLVTIVLLYYLVKINTSRWENRLIQKNVAIDAWKDANQKRRRFMKRLEKNGGLPDYSDDLSRLVREEIYLYMNFLKTNFPESESDSGDGFPRLKKLLNMLRQNERRVVMQNLFLQYPAIMKKLGFTFLDVPPEETKIFDDNEENDWDWR